MDSRSRVLEEEIKPMDTTTDEMRSGIREWMEVNDDQCSWKDGWFTVTDVSRLLKIDREMSYRRMRKLYNKGQCERKRVGSLHYYRPKDEAIRKQLIALMEKENDL